MVFVLEPSAEGLGLAVVVAVVVGCGVVRLVCYLVLAAIGEYVRLILLTSLVMLRPFPENKHQQLANRANE